MEFGIHLVLLRRIVQTLVKEYCEQSAEENIYTAEGGSDGDW